MDNSHNAYMLVYDKRYKKDIRIDLTEEVIKKDICIEACPLSNKVLGYTLDLKIHPIRWMLYHGL